MTISVFLHILSPSTIGLLKHLGISYFTHLHIYQAERSRSIQKIFQDRVTLHLMLSWSKHFYSYESVQNTALLLTEHRIVEFTWRDGDFRTKLKIHKLKIFHLLNCLNWHFSGMIGTLDCGLSQTKLIWRGGVFTMNLDKSFEGDAPLHKEERFQQHRKYTRAHDFKI